MKIATNKRVRPKGWRLTLVQINEARSLHFEHKWTWRKLARHFKCDDETVRRAIDPEFERHRRDSYQRRKEHLQRIRAAARLRSGGNIGRPRLFSESVAMSAESYDVQQRRSVVRADNAFCDAMSIAIRCGRENAMVGIDKRPSSPDARYTPSRGLALSHGSVVGSSAGMCADS